MWRLRPNTLEGDETPRPLLQANAAVSKRCSVQTASWMIHCIHLRSTCNSRGICDSSQKPRWGEWKERKANESTICTKECSWYWMIFVTLFCEAKKMNNNNNGEWTHFCCQRFRCWWVLNDFRVSKLHPVVQAVDWLDNITKRNQSMNDEIVNSQLFSSNFVGTNYGTQSAPLCLCQ